MPTLSAADREHFLAHGFVRLEQAIEPQWITRWVERMWPRLGYDPTDPATWTEAKVHMPSLEHQSVAVVAPRAWEAIGELCGGHDRVKPTTWSDGFIANFSFGRGKPWLPPGPQIDGWHKDGDFFRHFLDSPEQGLLSIVLWSDVVEQGGPTYLIADSIAPVARYLAAHPEGVSPNGFPFETEIIPQCRDFRAATGRAGDVFLMHPFMLHTSSYNPLNRPRLITNPPVFLHEPMRLDRERWDDHSLVEQATLRGLGCERFAFTPTAARERIVPERVRRQEKMLAAERERLGETAS